MGSLAREETTVWLRQTVPVARQAKPRSESSLLWAWRPCDSVPGACWEKNPSVLFLHTCVVIIWREKLKKIRNDENVAMDFSKKQSRLCCTKKASSKAPWSCTAFLCGWTIYSPDQMHTITRETQRKNRDYGSCWKLQSVTPDMQSPHSREPKNTSQRGWESWMDGVQWRHCLSDAAIILFPLGGKERDTVWICQRQLLNITEHHQRHDGGEPLLALRLLNVAGFRLRRLNRIPHFMRSSKNVLQLHAETAARTRHRE